MEERTDERHLWMWVGLAAGAAAGAVAVMLVLRQVDAPHRVERLLRRCEDRIHNIEGSLSDLESSLSTS
ncbi:MAG: hypothetical protein JXA57_07155 [Armatimonadetes bacterium]|nr:hypothetical protein [Armatimonadota bacterium]